MNIVPDLAVGRLNIRVPDAAAEAWFRTRLTDITDAFNKQEGLACELHGEITSPPKPETVEQSKVMQRIQRAADTISQEITWQNTGGVCDGNKLAAAGLANIDTLGPLGDRLHSHEEWVSLSSIPKKIQLAAEVICDFARQPPTGN